MYPVDSIVVEALEHCVLFEHVFQAEIGRDLLHLGPLPSKKELRSMTFFVVSEMSGMPSGSFGPTTAGRMDMYVDGFQAKGGSMIMIGKGNRSAAVTQACKKHGGFYLGSIGGVAATLADSSIKKVEVLDMEELGMEAVWKIEVEGFPAFMVVDDKGNDFFKKWSKDAAQEPEADSHFDEMRDIFHGLDQDKSGKISFVELRDGLGVSDEKAVDLMARFDVDRDGVLDAAEIEFMLRKDESVREMLHK